MINYDNVTNLKNVENVINDTTYKNYFFRLSLIATSLFTWEGLDELGGNSRNLEQCLFYTGRGCIVKDKELGFLSINANPSDSLNVYRLPTRINAWSIGYSKMYDIDDCVYIFNNEMQIPTLPFIEQFAYRLYECERTCDINLSVQKTPALIEGDTKSVLTLKNLYRQYSGNMPVLFGNKEFNLDKKLNAINLNIPFIADKIDIHKHEIWNDFLTFIGINNANTDKKERLVTDEVNSNNDEINYNLNIFYKTRKKACDEFNKKYFNGEEKIRIKLNEDVLDLIKEMDKLLGGDDDGEIYDNNSNSIQE